MGRWGDFCKPLTRQNKFLTCKGNQDQIGTWLSKDMFIANTDTPHPVPGISRYQAMMNKSVRTKLDYTVPRKERSSRDKMLDKMYGQYKETMAHECGISKEHNFVGGADVLLSQRKRNKRSTPYEPVFYTMTKISGSATYCRWPIGPVRC